MNQGIGRLAFYSLVRVGKGFALALILGTPIGFLLGLSRTFHQSFETPEADDSGSRPAKSPPSSSSFCVRHSRTTCSKASGPNAISSYLSAHR